LARTVTQKPMTGPVARRYARALLGLVSPQEVDAVGEQLDALALALSISPALRDILFSPTFGRESKRKALLGVARGFNANPMVRNLMNLLVDRNRVDEIPAIANIYRDLSDERTGRARARVVTAQPLPKDVGARLSQALSQVVAHEVTMQTEVDAKILGGVQAQVGSLLFDGSVKTKLEVLRRELKQA
jgi:F-type H+-transporting ATPase subunit delta